MSVHDFDRPGGKPGGAGAAGEPQGDTRSPLAVWETEPVAVRAAFALRDTGNRWQPRAWALASVEPCEAGPGALELRLFRDEAEGYYLNVTSEEPSIFVMWRSPADDGLADADEAAPPRAIAVTVSYNEAGRWMDGGERVDRVPMPAELVAWVSEYANLQYRPERGKKRKGAKPSFMRRDEFAGMVERERESAARVRDSSGNG